MSFSINNLDKDQWPGLLKEIPQPPQNLNYRGQLPSPDMKLLAVVGSRHYSDYGRQVVDELISGLRGYNIGIVSGLALGIDSLAHEAALKNNLYTLSIPGSGLDDEVIYPARHRPLARRILESGGGLLSEFDPTFKATTWSFPQRNRLVCGIAEATLVIEAAEQSGSLITARMATDYNRELLVVPGNIFSANSKGTHQFLKLGATPVTESKDILDILKLEIENTHDQTKKVSPDEEKVLNLLSEPTERDTLIRHLGLPANQASILLMQMELSGLIKEQSGTYYKGI